MADDLQCENTNKRRSLLRLFELEPHAKILYGFAKDRDAHESKMFEVHSKAIVDMVDCAVACLGPDLDLLTEHLRKLGERHLAYGVKPEYFPFMQTAVMYALEELLGDCFTREEKKDWSSIFELMISEMTQGMKSKP